jgi:NTP pyrophosphatase (non-canonical NTP hydrolase)
MDRVDFTFDEYQANVLRTANRRLDWSQTVENCLLGLIGELGEIVDQLNPDNQLLASFVTFSKIMERIKKAKYHGKPLAANEYPEQVATAIKTFIDLDSRFNVKETANLKKELGDLQYYHTWLVDTLGFDASEVAQENVDKLRKRYGEGFSVEASLNRID